MSFEKIGGCKRSELVWGWRLLAKLRGCSYSGHMAREQGMWFNKRAWALETKTKDLGLHFFFLIQDGIAMGKMFLKATYRSLWSDFVEKVKNE